LNFNLIKQAIYATYLTNKVGFRLRKNQDRSVILHSRLEYANTLLTKLGISVAVTGKEKLTPGAQYCMICNHRSIIDPTIVELALEGSGILGYWVSKKELYNSFFFGLFTRNTASILLDRDADSMGSFFKDVKACVKQGDSIFIFPEGTRNKEDTTLTSFKSGSHIIARRNKLNILPIYIKTNADVALKDALRRKPKSTVIDVVIGDVIDYKDKSEDLETLYRNTFNLV